MLRALAATARLPNLPTVWSNAQTGYLVGLGLSRTALAGTKVQPHFSWLLAAAVVGSATFLYLLGTFLNDAVDEVFDRAHRPERPIPQGQFSPNLAANLALAFGAVGVACALPLGKFSLVVAGVLAVAVLLYTWAHKKSAAGIVVMGLCRALLYPLGALAGMVMFGKELHPVLGWACALGVAQGIYVAGLSLAARSESAGAVSKGRRAAALTMLCLPILLPALGLGVLCCLPDSSISLNPNLLAAALATVGGLGWVWFASAGFRRSTGVFVSRALAGIALVDMVPMLVFGAFSPWTALIPLACFGLALLLQRAVAAT